MQSQDNARIIRFVAVGAMVQSIEFFIPYPVPGAKLGLANIITLLAIAGLDYSSAFQVAFFRPIVASFLMGTFLSPTFVISFLSSIVSFFAMWLLNSVNGYLKIFSLFGISIFGATVHNISQLLVVYLWLMKIPEIFYLLPLLVIAGVISGGFVGYCAGYIYPLINFNSTSVNFPSENLEEVKLKDKLRLLIGIFLITSSMFLTEIYVYVILNLVLFIVVFKRQLFRRYLRFLIISSVFFVFPVIFGRGVSEGLLYSSRILFLFQISLWLMSRSIMSAVLSLFPNFLMNSALVIVRAIHLMPILAETKNKLDKKNLKGILTKLAEMLN